MIQNNRQYCCTEFTDIRIFCSTAADSDTSSLVEIKHNPIAGFAASPCHPLQAPTNTRFKDADGPETDKFRSMQHL